MKTIKAMKVSMSIFLMSLMFYSCNQSRHDILTQRKIVRKYYDDGKLQGEYEVLDSIRDGEQKIYFPSGNVQFKLHYVKDQLDGPATSYYESGEVKKIANYSHNKLNGEFMSYFQNGNMANRGSFYNDLLVGKYVEFFEEKNQLIKLIKEYQFVVSKSHLVSVEEFDRKGNLIKGSTRLQFYRKNDKVVIQVVDKEFDYLRAVIGRYDNLFNLKGIKPDTIKSTDNIKVEIPLFEGDTVRGFIENYEYLDKGKTISKEIWFSYPPVR
jgi:antitoxin component YwqK of YwqJK toxin-antitoxin module